MAAVLESVFTDRVVGGVLLVPREELLGALPIRVGPVNLSLNATGMPYASHPINSLVGSAGALLGSSSRISASLTGVGRTQAELRTATESEFRDRIVFGVVETIRRNESLKNLVDSAGTLALPDVRRIVRDYSGIDFGPLESAVAELVPFLSRRKQRRALSRFAAPIRELVAAIDTRPLELDLAVRELVHFKSLLMARKTTEASWRTLLFDLIDKQFAVPAAPVYSWCAHCFSGAMVEFLEGDRFCSPARCPWCDRVLRVLSSFSPSGRLADSMATKDGLLGVAVGWHLRRLGMRFRGAMDIGGAEVDFLIGRKSNTTVLECKMHNVLASEKALASHVADDGEQLCDHVRRVESAGRRVRRAACIVNLTRPSLRRALNRLRNDSRMRALGKSGGQIVSFQDFPAWISAQV